MSEYWKSTPKYWCKFCKTFVRDTNLEKKNHEATPKHQSNIQRSLRDLHKTSEREEREKQRAKDEVARLNGLVAGKAGGAGASGSRSGVGGFTTGAKATPEERKRQQDQLAAMGIFLPGRPTDPAFGGGAVDPASANGGWTTVSETPIYATKDEDGDTKPAVASFGVRKRKLDEEEDEAEAEAEAVLRKGWGSRFKTYPGSKDAQDDDLDALLSSAVVKKKEVKKEGEETEVPVKTEDDAKDIPSALKKEESIGEVPPLAAIPDVTTAAIHVKQEEAPVDPPVVFKKRKGKR